MNDSVQSVNQSIENDHDQLFTLERNSLHDDLKLINYRQIDSKIFDLIDIINR